VLPKPLQSHVPGPGRANEGRVRRPRRLSASSLVPMVLAVLAAVFSFEALQDRSAMYQVVVARTVITEGQLIGTQNTRFVEIHASDVAQERDLLTPAGLGQNWQAAVELRPGEALTLAEVTTRSSTRPLGEMSIPVPIDQAVGGALASGDQVDVIQADGAGGARYIAQGLRVLSVASAGPAGGVLGNSSGAFFIVVAVSKQVALRVSAAEGASGSAGGSSSIEVIRSNGENRTGYVSFHAAPSAPAGQSLAPKP
jgi:hypothetical protein